MTNLLNTLSENDLRTLVTRAKNLWNTGTCCPTQCRVNRLEKSPPCGAVNNGIKVASFAVHDGEEPPISGWNGAGNIFFSGCTLKCIYCQNWPISHENNGKIYREDQFFQEVQKLLLKKVHNINLVTSDHYLYPILNVFSKYRYEINVPIVYNCSGYFQPELLDIVLSIADIFLYDVKYTDKTIAKEYSTYPGYVDADWNGMERLLSENIPFIEDDLGLLKRGLIIRHLVMPGAVENSLNVLEKLADYRDKGLIFKLSLMSQYFPAYQSIDHPVIGRRLTEEEYTPVVEKMETLGIDGWIQGL